MLLRHLVVQFNSRMKARPCKLVTQNKPGQSELERNAMRKLSIVSFIVTAMTPLPAIAYTQDDVNACTPDVMRLCMSAIPDAGRVTQCLVQNKKQLSSACTVVFSRPRAASAERERPAIVEPASY
jgi:hypothetical protein